MLRRGQAAGRRRKYAGAAGRRGARRHDRRRGDRPTDGEGGMRFDCVARPLNISLSGRTKRSVRRMELVKRWDHSPPASGRPALSSFGCLRIIAHCSRTEHTRTSVVKIRYAARCIPAHVFSALSLQTGQITRASTSPCPEGEICSPAGGSERPSSRRWQLQV